MKICAVQAVISMTLCSLAVAHNNYGQVLDQKITLSIKEVSLEEALDEIEGATDVKFFYSVDQLSVKDKISFEVSGRSLRDLLDEILTPYRIEYKVHEKKSTITLKKQHDEIASEVPASNPAATITGKVTDAATQQPIAGVNVVEKGTTNGTVSDVEGRYTITVQDESMLVFSFIGYKIYEIEVNGNNVIDVTLDEEVATLEEVTVNAGYWTVKEREKTGSIARLDAGAIANQPVSNPMAALQGRMAGVYITESAGVPGAGFSIQIRGQNSLRSDGNDPLYIVDGVPYTAQSLLQESPSQVLHSPSPLSALNPLDIENIEVLKDADATAIYGSRGANGVVLITTKKGKGGKTEFNIDVATGQGKVANRVNMLSTPQYLEMRNEALTNDGKPPGSTDYDVNGTWDQTRYSDWQNVLIGGTANFTNAQLSLSGGNDNTRFLIGAGYNKQGTVYPGDMFYQRGSGHFNLNHISDHQKFSINLSTNVSLESNNLTDNTYEFDLYDLAPNSPPLYDDSGNLNWENSTWENPLADLENEYQANVQNLISSITTSYEVLPGLMLKTSLGFNSIHTKELKLNPISAKDPANPNAKASAHFGRSTGNTWIAEPQVQYQRDVFRGKIAALVGMTLQANNQESISILTNDIENDELLQNISSAPRESVIGSNSFSQYKYMAAFIRANYNWSEKYLVNITARRDGSSRFGTGKKFGNFGAIGAAWIFSNENFIKDRFLFLTFGKLRGSYGITGSDQIGNYGYLDSYESGSTSSQYQGSGLTPARLANPDYAWETNKKIEGAIELGFLQNRILVTTAYYRNRSSDQLVGLPLPATTGFSSVQFNLPATVQNTGLEFEVSSINITSTDLSWQTSLNLSVPRTKLIEYPNLEASVYANTYRVGEPLTIALTYEYLGVDSLTGVYQFADLNESGSFTSSDNLKIVRSGLHFYGGMQNTFKYKGLELNIFFQFVKKTSASYRVQFTTPGQLGNQSVEVMKRWQSAGDIIDIQKFSTLSSVNTAHGRWIGSDEAREDASFFRLKNVSLSWRIPTHWSSKLRLQNARIYLQGQNLLTFTNYRGLDPENRSIPPLRTITCGIQLTF